MGDAIIARDKSNTEQVYAGRVHESNPRLKYVVVMMPGGGVRVFAEGAFEFFRVEKDKDATVLADGGES